MDDQITPEEALELVTFRRNCDGDWFVRHVHGNVEGIVFGDIKESVWGTINGRNWFFETPRARLQRLTIEGADKAELLEALNQLEDN